MELLEIQHSRSNYVEATFHMAGISPVDSSTHIDTQPATIAAFEKKCHETERINN
jgi:hypothetical protein